MSPGEALNGLNNPVLDSRRVFNIRTCFGTWLGVKDGRLIHGTLSAIPSLITCFRSKSDGGVIFIAGNSPLAMDGEIEATSLLSYRSPPLEGDFHFCHPSTGKFVRVEAIEAGKEVGTLSCIYNEPGELGCFSEALNEPLRIESVFPKLIELDDSEHGLLHRDGLLLVAASDTPQAVPLLVALLRLVPEELLRDLVPALARMPLYEKMFQFLRMHLSGHNPIWGAYTRLVFADEILRFGWEIGDHTYGTPTVSEAGFGHLRIGRYSSIDRGVNIILADRRTDAWTTYPFTALRSVWPGSDPSQPDHQEGSVDIGSDVWIGANVCVLPGTFIGDGCIVGAGAVVRGYVPPYSVVAGNPGKVVKSRYDPVTVARLINSRWWDLPDAAVDRLIPGLLDTNSIRFLPAAEAARREFDPQRNVLKGELQLCTELWGECSVIENDPEVSIVKDVFYLPYRHNESWGIFNDHGEAIPEAVDHHGPERSTAGQVLQADPELLRVAQAASDFDYVYGGAVNLHYGHFLANTLPRLWFLMREGLGGRKILCHGSATVADWFKRPFIAELFAGLGLAVDDFAHFEVPVRVRRLTITSPAFEEQHFSHRIFGDLCHRIGESIGEGGGGPRVRRPAYLSKTRMTAGVGRFVNESEVVKALDQAGFEIIYPETLSFREQVAFFASRDVIVGSTGSALHTSIFVREPLRLIGINPIHDVNSNFVLMDRLGQHDARYYFPADTKVVQPRNSKFITSFQLANPQRTAGEIIRLVDHPLSE